ncbi:MAG: FadR family transcriptional regulator [Spirochaetales bacterium]|nr:FadR family transcriptional regulator [Spirochaetales bacterium]
MEKKRAELVRTLTDMIREPGRFGEGRLPPERELAASLGVSRNLLREAIITMEVMGLLEIRERQGAFIATPQADEFAASLKFLSLWPDDILTHLMEMRLVIEVPASGLAAVRRTTDEVIRLHGCIRHLEDADAARDAEAAGTWDAQLHTLVVKAAHNPVLDRVYEGLSSTMETYVKISRRKLLALEQWPEKILDQHKRLVEAMEAGDPLAAQQALRDHLEGALRTLVELRSIGA